jgi:hypothetical protein
LLANSGNARVIHVAWDGLGERPDVISPVSAVTILTAE